jgi:hypothetical protein
MQRLPITGAALSWRMRIVVFTLLLCAAGCTKPPYGITPEAPFGNHGEVLAGYTSLGYTQAKLTPMDRFIIGSVTYSKYSLRQNGERIGYIVFAKTGKGQVVGVKAYLRPDTPLQAKTIAKTMWKQTRTAVPVNPSQFSDSKSMAHARVTGVTGNGLKGYWMKSAKIDQMWLLVEKGSLSETQLPGVDLKRLM